ncbi:DUF6464 family protein [Stenomitos frigidus]|uniref:Uncharacterized protein n=1 Tax=Stenomitos frigidus ULC18 TaxID=2107698 RepID=A0A2T1E345_9CYAN|nr:DUF6464 family protein [Stenomitos frigidus]PSB27156.1 hypothetical protein C7B82_16890 [Stenomitos frigidus ULC18]
MLKALFIIAIGLIPAMLSWVLMRKAEAHLRTRLRSAMNASASRRLGRFYGSPLSADHHYVEGVGYLIGDITCRFNARSAHIRCAINPSGPCKQCLHYESIEFD